MSSSDAKVEGGLVMEGQTGFTGLGPGDFVIAGPGPVEIFRFKADGEVFYKGGIIVSDKMLVDGLREALLGIQNSTHYKVTRVAEALMADWSELDDVEEDAEVWVSAALMMKIRSLLEL